MSKATHLGKDDMMENGIPEFRSNAEAMRYARLANGKIKLGLEAITCDMRTNSVPKEQRQHGTTHLTIEWTHAGNGYATWQFVDGKPTTDDFEKTVKNWQEDGVAPKWEPQRTKSKGKSAGIEM